MEKQLLTTGVIVCREDQIKGEMDDLFDFLHEMYGLLGMTFKLKLSTRPEKYLGEIETWDRAEAVSIDRDWIGSDRLQ